MTSLSRGAEVSCLDMVREVRSKTNRKEEREGGGGARGCRRAEAKSEEVGSNDQPLFAMV